MATDLGRVTPAAASKYDAFVAEQLARAEGRIRLLDLTAALLGFAALALAYIVGMVVCDSKFELAPQTRQGTLYLFLAGSALYLFFTVVRPLRLRVNPYYAARQVERQLPGAKNSIVNWVDLHTQPLPPAIRGALGQRAAKDLSRVDLDSAISGRRAAWAGGLAGLFALAFVISFFLLGPSPFYSLLKRAFNPFGQVGVSTRTQLTILKPEGGDAVVTVGRGVYFVVEVAGKVPDPRAADAVKLLYRYEDDEPWLERLLMNETGREWTAQLSALEVQNGFSYKITGGDATTDVYRVSVRAAPAVTDFLATYIYRPYVARAAEVRRERSLKALRGTEVHLRIHTNRTLRDGRLEFEGKEGTKVVRGLPDPGGDPHVLLVFFQVEEDGRYRLHFTSTEGEAYSDPAPYPVTAIPDLPPTVELTKPGQDIRLPADGLLHLEGKAGDDIGVKRLALQMEIVGGERLREQIYRGEDALRLADGGYPREVEYKDFVELSRVKNQQGQPVRLRAGMELEYWLEASDACDYPHANLTSSKHFRVLLTEPEKNEAKRQQEKKQAEQDKKQHEQKQDQQLQQESQERRQERQEQEAHNKEEQDKSNQADKGAGDAPQKNEGGKGEGDDKGAQGDPNNGEGESQNGLSKEQQDIENRIKDALAKQQGENGQAEGKPDKNDQGEGKGEPQNNQAGEKSEGEGKDAGGEAANQAGEGKDKGQPQPGGDAPQGDGKGDNSSKPMPGDKGEPKGDQPMNQPGAGAGEASEGKNKGKPDAAPQAGEGKPGGDAQNNNGAGESKPQPAGQGQNASGAGENKPADTKGEQAKGEAAGEAKDNAGGSKRTEPKGPGDTKDDSRAEGKKGDAAPKGDSSSSGDSKPMNPGAGENTAQGDAKPDPDAQARNATPKDVAEMAKDLQSGDAQKREEAKRQLERIAKEARDSQAREQAGEALDKAGQPDGPSEDTKPQPGNGSSGQSSDGKKGDKGGKGDGSKGAGAGSGGKGDKGEGESNSQGQGEKRGKNNSTGSGTASSAQNREGNNTPGGGGNRRDSDNPAAAGGDGGSPSPAKPSKPRDHRAAQMQLDDFLKKVDKKILKDAGVSEEAWKKYLEARRKQLAPPEKPRAEAPADPRQAVQLPSMGGRTIQSPSSTPGDAQSSDRGQPPPGYRDRFREFSRQMSNKKN